MQQRCHLVEELFFLLQLKAKKKSIFFALNIEYRFALSESYEGAVLFDENIES
jgi:hypothetical protein